MMSRKSVPHNHHIPHAMLLSVLLWALLDLGHSIPGGWYESPRTTDTIVSHIKYEGYPSRVNMNTAQNERLVVYLMPRWMINMIPANVADSVSIYSIAHETGGLPKIVIQLCTSRDNHRQKILRNNLLGYNKGMKTFDSIDDVFKELRHLSVIYHQTTSLFLYKPNASSTEFNSVMRSYMLASSSKVSINDAVRTERRRAWNMIDPENADNLDALFCFNYTVLGLPYTQRDFMLPLILRVLKRKYPFDPPTESEANNVAANVINADRAQRIIGS